MITFSLSLSLFVSPPPLSLSPSNPLCYCRSMFNDWNANYEKITDMIVPRSTQLIYQDNDYGLFTVTLFKKVSRSWIQDTGCYYPYSFDGCLSRLREQTSQDPHIHRFTYSFINLTASMA